MSLEDDVRRQMEIAAAQQASGMENSSECPLGDDVDAAFGPSSLMGKKDIKKRSSIPRGRPKKAKAGPTQTKSILGKHRM